MSTSPPSAGSGAGSPAYGLVVLAEPLPEAAVLGAALRPRGYAVEVRTAAELAASLAKLRGSGEKRARAETAPDAPQPWAVILDGSVPDAEAVVSAVRALDTSATTSAGDADEEAPAPTRRSAPWLGPLLVAVGVTPPAESLGLRAPDGAFERPVDLDGLLRFLDEASGRRAAVGPSSKPAALVAPPDAETLPRGDSLPNGLPSLAGLPEVDAILPSLDPERPPTSQTSTGLSDEIEGLLASSAQRVHESRPESDPQRTRNGDPILVSQDMLMSLDELLVGDEDGGATGSATGSHLPPVQPHSERLAARSSRSASMLATPAGGSQGATEAGRTAFDRSLTADGTAAHTAERTSSSIPPELESRSSVGSMVRTEQHDVSSRPPTGPPAGSVSRPPLPLTDSLPIPSPTIGTVEGGRQTMPSLPVQTDVMGPGSQPPWPSAPPTVPWTAQLDPWSTSPSESPREGVSGPSELPRPSSMPPPRTWAELQAASESEAPPGADEGDPMSVLARCIAQRATGALAVEAPPSPRNASRLRWIVLRDGDIVTATSELNEEGLVHFLVERGQLSSDIAELQASRLPHAGRHAAAALIAHGFLEQDELWPVLRAHAEWLVARAMAQSPRRCQLHRDAPDRLHAEPNVFGGAAGVEVFIETARRVLAPNVALQRLGGRNARLAAGPHGALLAESALSPTDIEAVRGGIGATVGDVLTRQGNEFAATLHALVALQVLASPAAGSGAPSPSDEAPAPASFDPLDAQAVRERVRARMALVQEADYFSLLGLTAEATDYEIRRAYLDLRRTFEPSRLLSAATADLADDVRLIVEILEEAYQILRDSHRRNRYRKAILASPQS